MACILVVDFLRYAFLDTQQNMLHTPCYITFMTLIYRVLSVFVLTGFILIGINENEFTIGYIMKIL